jgi:hypothetical protein
MRCETVAGGKVARARRYREQIVKIKGMMGLKLNWLRGLEGKKVLRPKIKRGHPFYVVAMIKERFGSFRGYVQASQGQHCASPSDRLSFNLGKLSVLLKSLSSLHSDTALSKKPAIDHVFNPRHRLLRKCLSRLSRYAALQAKQRKLALTSLAFSLHSCQSRAFSHWHARHLL